MEENRSRIRRQERKNKKRRGYIMITAAVLGLITLSSVFASARTDEDIIRELVSLRTDTLSGFYAGEIDREDAIKTINSIEGDHLLKEDLQNIDLYFQTDIEQVKEYSFEKISVTKSEEDMICADVTMEWEAEGIDGTDNFTVTYNVICQKDKESYKLVQFF